MLFFAFLAGCLLGEKADDEYPTCVDSPTDLAPDAASPAGFSAADILAFSTGARSETLTWSDGTTTPLSLEITGDGTGAQWIDSVADYPDGGTTIDIGIVCTSRLEVPVTLAFATEDGAFAESFDTTLVASAADSATVSVELADAALVGTFDPESVPTDDYDSMSLTLAGLFDASGDSGSISGYAQKDNGCDTGGSCSASSESLDVATWGHLPM